MQACVYDSLSIGHAFFHNQVNSLLTQIKIHINVKGSKQSFEINSRKWRELRSASLALLIKLWLLFNKFYLVADEDDDGADASSQIPLDDDAPPDYGAIEVIQCLIEHHNAIFTDANETTWG